MSAVVAHPIITIVYDCTSPTFVWGVAAILWQIAIAQLQSLRADTAYAATRRNTTVPPRRDCGQFQWHAVRGQATH